MTGLVVARGFNLGKGDWISQHERPTFGHLSLAYRRQQSG
jgi:hypothetical protein